MIQSCRSATYAAPVDTGVAIEVIAIELSITQAAIIQVDSVDVILSLQLVIETLGAAEVDRAVVLRRRNSRERGRNVARRSRLGAEALRGKAATQRLNV